MRKLFIFVFALIILLGVSFVIAASAPTITNVQIKPSPAYSTDVLNCSANYNDADGDKGNVSIYWYNGSNLYWKTTQFNKINGEQMNEPLTWVSTNGLVGYWKFSEGSGNEARDISGNGNNGAVSGATWTEGKLGKALSFDGINDYVNITNMNAGNFNYNEDFSLSAWIKPTAATIGAIISKENRQEDGYSLIFTKNQTIAFIVGGTVTNKLVLFLDANNLNSYTSGGTTWVDLSNKSNNATLNPTIPALGTTSGVTSFAFSGSTAGNGDMVISNFYTNYMSLNDNHTYEAMVNSPGSALDPWNAGGNPYIAYLESRWFYDSTGGHGFDPGFIGSQWHIYGLTQQNTSTAKSYVDGNFSNTRTDWITPSSASSGITMGSRSWSNRAQNFYMSTVRFYNRTLSPAEMRQNFYSIAYRMGMGNETTTTTVNLNEYSHVVATKSGNNCSIYINGVIAQSYLCTINQNMNGQLFIGARASGVTEFFNGAIDEVSIYNRALSQAEINEIYTNTPHANGETWNCTINATDSSGATGVPVSTTKTIGGSSFSPTITSVQIKPSPAYSNDVLNCSANYNDENSDKGNITLLWYNGSNLYWQTTQFNKMNGEVVNEPLTWIDKNGLVGYWKFSEGNGTEALDISGNGNNEVLNNFNFNANSGWVDGKFGKALHFDGTDDYIQKSSAGFANQPKTISLWFKVDSINTEGAQTYQKMTLIQYGDIYWGLQISSATSRIQYYYYDGAQKVWNSNDIISMGNWYHLVVVSNSTGSEMFLNGTSQGSGGIGFTLLNNICGSTCNLVIGGNIAGYPSGDSFNGTIDEVAIYNRNLASEEIGEIYSSSPHAKNEVWNCTINATDSTGTVGLPNSTTRTISSTSIFAPAITNIQIKPSPAYSNDVLNCSANYNDANGDKGNVSIYWYNGSTLYWQITQFNKLSGEQVNEPLAWIDKNGLVGYWKFSEGNGTQTRDISGRENNGTLTNFNWNTNSGWVQGKYGSGLQFDGLNDYVVTPSTADFAFGTGAFAVSGWFYIPQLPSTYYVFKSSATSGGFSALIGPNRFSFGRSLIDETTIVWYTPPVNQWFHLAMTRSGTMGYFYLNGVLIGTNTSTASYPAGNTVIGIDGNYAGFPFNGTIDEFMIYNRTLTSAEISEIYSNSPHARGETWNCTINATDSQGSTGLPNSTTITVESVSGYEPKWKHVTVTYSASKREKKIYVDNMLIRTEKLNGLGSYKINNQSGNLYVSKLYGVPSGNMFNGSIDEMRIYPYALSSNEVSTAYLGSINYDNLPSSQNEATTLELNGEGVTEMTLAPIIRVSNKERTCEVTSKVKIPKCA